MKVRREALALASPTATTSHMHAYENSTHRLVTTGLVGKILFLFTSKYYHEIAEENIIGLAISMHSIM